MFTGIATVAALLFAGSAGYTVRAGDTLWSIARSHGVTLSALASANGLRNPNVIHPGTQLRIPGGAAGATSSASTGATTVHVVVPGETLMGISIRYQVLMRDIAGANGFTNLNWVYAGQRLKIPSASAAPAAAPAATSTPAAAPMATARADVGRMLESTASEYGFKPSFVKALAYMESGWNQEARSSVGAVGVMQVLPSTGDFVERYLVGRPLDVTSTQDNITAGVAFLDYLWRLTGGDVDRTLAGYYQGLRSVEENGMYPSTKSYIANILALRDRF
jgi:LysM repeat protein